jgi:hypothetical protein
MVLQTSISMRLEKCLGRNVQVKVLCKTAVWDMRFVEMSICINDPSINMLMGLVSVMRQTGEREREKPLTNDDPNETKKQNAFNDCGDPPGPRRIDWCYKRLLVYLREVLK